MNSLDWVILLIYFAGLVGMSLWLRRGQTDERDYYVGGRNLPWWAVGLSTMATQSSAISFLSIPAFVALKPDGGLVWLQYELAVPLAMIVVMAFLVPFFRRLELVSVYQYLELRFDPAVRLFISAVFLFSRGLGAGVALYASALVLHVILDLPLWLTILLMGVITIIYDTLGGMKTVVYSDVLQMVLLVIGVVLCIFTALHSVNGDFFDAISALAPERRQAIVWATGFDDGATRPFWGFLIGGLFLYIAYYGTDQSQVQRGLSTPDIRHSRRALLLNGFARFPLTLSYVLMGLAVGLAYQRSPELQAAVAGRHADYLIPQFIIQEIPDGIRAVIIAAILAAAMSSLDSALNSLSAVTQQDFIQRGQTLTPRRALLWGKVTTVAWGVVITGFAFMVGNIADTIIESINKIGSAFYGPVLAAFLVGLLSARASSAGVLTGVIAGVSSNIYLWLMHAQIFWMWWNVTGLLVAILTTLIVSPFTTSHLPDSIRPYTLKGANFLRPDRSHLITYLALLGYFFGMLSFLVTLPDFMAG